MNRYIIPKFGRRKLNELTRGEVARLHSAIGSTPYMANYTIAVLRSFYSWAGRRGLAPDGYNPARQIDKFREDRRERFLTSEELLRLGRALRDAETTGIPWNVDTERRTAKHIPKAGNRFTVIDPYAVAAIRLLS